MKGNDDLLDFAAGGEHRDSGNMWPHSKTDINDAILGRVIGLRRVGKGDDAYDVVTFAPAVIMEGGKPSGFAAVSMTLSATLKGRITSKDEKGVLAVIYKGKAKGAGPQPYKLFDVHEQSEEKLVAVLERIGAPADIISAAKSDSPF